jgi:hypothetical protein
MKENEMPEGYAEYLKEEEKFWTETYPSLSFSEKGKYWVGAIYSMMRSSGEVSGDEYEDFSPENYAIWKEDEKDIDLFLAQLKFRLFKFDEEEMWRRIGKR